MKLSRMMVILVLGAGLFAPVPARACMNDRSTVTAENEFKSTYLKKTEEPASVTQIWAGGWVAIGMGVVLTGLAAFVAMRGKRS